VLKNSNTTIRQRLHTGKVLCL